MTSLSLITQHQIPLESQTKIEVEKILNFYQTCINRHQKDEISKMYMIKSTTVFNGQLLNNLSEIQNHFIEALKNLTIKIEDYSFLLSGNHSVNIILKGLLTDFQGQQIPFYQYMLVTTSKLDELGYKISCVVHRHSQDNINFSSVPNLENYYKYLNNYSLDSINNLYTFTSQVIFDKQSYTSNIMSFESKKIIDLLKMIQEHKCQYHILSVDHISLGTQRANILVVGQMTFNNQTRNFMEYLHLTPNQLSSLQFNIQNSILLFT